MHYILLSHQPDIYEMYLCTKDPFEAEYQLLINKRKNAVSKHCNNSKLNLWMIVG